ncbi:MAG: hypothetical protein ACKVG0_03905 [Alphaproteobacteria bacterium]|jgi:ElaB/YqjD/DUF883 family membrane-anchored ribosome-binding protein
MANRGEKKPVEGDELRAKLATLREELENLQGSMKGLAGDAGDAAAAKMNAAINDAMASVQDTAERVEDWGEDHLASVRESVREQPLAACVLAMGAGALVAAFLFRR